MISLLLAERMPADGKLLVLGAGGGLEIKALAEAHAGWSFLGVDPSAEMLALAEQTTKPHQARVRLQHGYIDQAPEGPFDGATCLLTMHFVPGSERLATLQAVRRRLRSGAPFIMAHISFAQTEPERTQWITRHVAFGRPDLLAPESAQEAIRSRLTVLSPEEEETMLAEAGFSGVSLFYAGLSFRGWISYAA
jgi:tRNA (cmo5U34)-methyltransferase